MEYLKLENVCQSHLNFYKSINKNMVSQNSLESEMPDCLHSGHSMKMNRCQKKLNCDFAKRWLNVVVKHLQFGTCISAISSQLFSIQ